MVQDSERKLGSFALKSYYSMAEAGEPDTLVIERTHIFRELTLDRTSTESERKLAVLEVVEGVDTDMTLEIGEGPTSIGRQETNDFILTDTNASRCHAYIDYEDHRHVIHDAGSTNGTFVNGKRVRKAMLQPGDRIRTGETVFRYEVI
jgi:FHA domain containing protein